jgi:hypothetical protein
MLTSTTLLTANDIQINTAPTMNEHVKNAVARVEAARDDTLNALKSMIHTVDNARKSGKENNRSISTQIIETHALSEIAKSTASVEVAKAKAMTLITHAIDKLDPDSLSIIADAVASVEIAKAEAKKNIIKATGRVELSKVKKPAQIEHGNETLTVAKNVSAIQIAKSVAQAEVAKAVSLIEIARSSVESALPNSMGTLTKKSKENLEDIKAKATANISSYLAQIEVMKANMLAKIAAEVAKVEIAKLHTNGEDNSTEKNSTTYPNKLIKAN